MARYPSPTLNGQYPHSLVAFGLAIYPIADWTNVAAYSPQVCPTGGLKMASSFGVQVTSRSCSSVAIIPPMSLVKGSSWYIHERQNSGIDGAGMVTPQNSAKRTIKK